MAQCTYAPSTLKSLSSNSRRLSRRWCFEDDLADAVADCSSEMRLVTGTHSKSTSIFSCTKSDRAQDRARDGAHNGMQKQSEMK